jgi:membrane protein
MREKRNWLTGIIQRMYITFDTFMVNDLFTYASAGAYSFFLSAFPVVLMVLVILVRLFNTSPEAIRELLGSTAVIGTAFDISPFFESVLSIRSIGLFEVIIGFSVFWMARRFFASLQQGMTVIYKKRGKGKPIKENLVVIAGEVILVILIVSTVIAIMAGNAFFRTAISEDILSPFLFLLLKNLFRFAPYAIVFVFLLLVYYITPRTRPSFWQSLLASAACTVAFAIVQLVFSSFVNMSRYNLVYGVLSNIIVIVLEVYMFFFLFLFFAQFQYVTQFFESFLLAQLYLMPGYRDPDPIKQLERILFIESPYFYKRYAVHKAKGDVVFKIGDDSTELYYVWRGFVRLEIPNQVIMSGRGHVFGEFSSIIGGLRTATAIAETDVTLLKIPASLFQDTIEIDGQISRRTLQMIADYVRKNNADALSSDR